MKINCANSEIIPIHKLIPNPKNPNVHPPSQIDRLAKIIDYQGQRHPIIVSKQSGFVVVGHGRLEAIKKLGWSEAAVDFQDFESPAQEYAFVVADNAIAEWADLDKAAINLEMLDLGPDFDIEQLGIEDFVLEMAEVLPPGDPDEVPGAMPDPKVQRGEVYFLGEHRLMCGDSTNIEMVENLLRGDKPEMVYTDPPYGINESAAKRVTRETNSLAKSNSHLKEFNDDTTQYAIDAYNHVAALGIPIKIFWGANHYCHALPESANWLVWDKRVEEKQTDMNSDCELAWVEDGHSSVRIFRHLWKGLIKGSERGDRRVHPTQKPVALAVWCFENYGEPKQVLDLFGGSGSTLIACEQTQRQCLMMELEPHYCQVILDRWEKFTGKKAKREDGTLWEDIKSGGE